jgi:hypothetical protein
LQTCIYHVAARDPSILVVKDLRCLEGTLYNVIRRPLSDNRAIKQRKGRLIKGKRVGAESEEQFIKRLEASIKANAAHYFMRWKVRIIEDRLNLFKARVLTPILEQLCDWWESIYADPFNPWVHRRFMCDPVQSNAYKEDGEATVATGQFRTGPNPYHYQYPWGIFNSMASGFRGDFFDLLTNGKQGNLIKVDTLFPEL